MKQGDLGGSLDASSEGLHASDLRREMAPVLAAGISYDGQPCSGDGHSDYPFELRTRDSNYQSHNPSLVTPLRDLLHGLLYPLLPFHLSSQTYYRLSSPRLVFWVQSSPLGFDGFCFSDFSESGFGGAQWGWGGNVIQVGCE